MVYKIIIEKKSLKVLETLPQSEKEMSINPDPTL